MTQLTSRDKITDIIPAKAKLKLQDKMYELRKKSKLIKDTKEHSLLKI